jgi:hypothetical protein
VAAQALARMRELYDIERKLRDADPALRRRVRLGSGLARLSALVAGQVPTGAAGST